MKTEFYKLSGLLGFIVAWFGMLVTIFSQGRHTHKSISLHAASSKKTFILLAILSPISMGLFMVFVAYWMMPTFDLSPALVLLTSIALTGYVLAAWVPAVEGIKGKLHDLFAYSASLLLILICLLLAASPNIAPIATFINALGAILMVAIFCILLWYKPARKQYLYYQIAYFLVFDLSLLAAGYIR